ncbi:hypothetical protein HIO71_14110 [Chryseobacterium aquaticum]|uniref:HEPN AbiU2-like domain-containing protein n=1 Tax=Chryseobacterium aquaticum TaxID=452084 RepID=A0A848N2I5_9FLAO|nr:MULTISPECIES: hypothetical protein [Chryseobacterium]NMR35317.1 hypothetical protein [Chryseobacterium aquaticum]NRQ47245.1 hypothetical protein [Chryseobacterium sp. C-204]
MSKILTTYDCVHAMLTEHDVELAEDFKTEFANFQYILVLAQFELCLVLKAIHYSQNDLEKIHSIKRGFLIIYETKIALDKLNPTLKTIKSDFPQLENEFKQAVYLIKDVRRIVNDDIRIVEVRNNVSAHINPNFLEYYKNFEMLELSKDLNLIMDMKNKLYLIEKFISTVRATRSTKN